MLFLLFFDPTLTTLLLDDALERDRPLGGLVLGARYSPVAVCTPGSSCVHSDG